MCVCVCVCVCVFQEFGGVDDLYAEERAKQEAARRQEEKAAVEQVPGLQYTAPQRSVNVDDDNDDLAS